jgi:hypothetical protein
MLRISSTTGGGAEEASEEKVSEIFLISEIGVFGLFHNAWKLTANKSGAVSGFSATTV